MHPGVPENAGGPIELGALPQPLGSNYLRVFPLAQQPVCPHLSLALEAEVSKLRPCLPLEQLLGCHPHHCEQQGVLAPTHLPTAFPCGWKGQYPSIAVPSPSFLHHHAAPARSIQTHPGLLWWQMRHGSSGLSSTEEQERHGWVPWEQDTPHGSGLQLPWLTLAVGFHAGCSVHRVPEEAVPRHLQTHHSGTHGTCRHRGTRGCCRAGGWVGKHPPAG